MSEKFRLSPSQPDLDFTAKVSAAGKLLDIPLIDHVIIGGGNGQHYSLAEHNQLGSTGNGFTVSENKGTYHISRKDRVADLTEKLKTGVADYLSSDSYKQLLNALAKFHRYSLNNSILIAMQNPGASQVASYSTWQSLNRQVNAGEKGIQILCPTPYKRKTSTEQIDDAQKSPVMDEQGSIVKAEPEVQYLGFRIGHVFDISQTSQIPGTEEIALSPVQELSGDVRRYDDIIRAITEISPVHIRFERFVGSAKGYFSSAEQEIVIKPDMSQAQTVKTLVHETCHSRIHNPLSQDSDIKQLGFSREDAEIQAESVAFITCSYLNDRYDLGLDTSSYSFPYVASWAGTPDKILPNLSVIKMAAEDLIGQIDMVMSQIKNDHIAEQHLFDKVIQTQPAKHLSL